ncbi:response regulator [Marinospirillum sp. MEB164]|uniref:Response regulator n=1 Tax=Marinospirillum alkalitolerans TaxID=3123374 RepID=A0ABW8PUG0_9GAMM
MSDQAPTLQTSSWSTRQRWLGLILPVAGIGLVLFVVMMVLAHLSHRASQDQLQRVTEARLLESAQLYAQALEADLRHLEVLGQLVVQETQRIHHQSPQDHTASLVTDSALPAAVYFADRVDPQQRTQRYQQWQVLAPLLETLHARSSLIQQIYINYVDTATLLYPWTDLDAHLVNDLDVRDFAFFYLADPEHNPQREPVWTEAYLDPAGQGWVVTLSLPVYVDDQFVAVVGIDVALNRLAQRLKAAPVILNGYTLLMSEAGHLLVFPPQVEGSGSLDASASVQQERNFFMRQGMRPNLAPLHIDHSGLTPLLIENQPSLVSWASLDVNAWKLLLVVPQDQAQAMSQQLQVDWRNMVRGSLFALVMMLFSLIFFTARHDRRWQDFWRAGHVLQQHPALSAERLAAPRPATSLIQQVHGPLLICHFDVGGRLVECNQAFERFAQETQSNLKGQPLAPLLGMRDLPPRPWVQELELHASAGQELSSWWASLHTDEAQGGYLIMLDISDYRQLQQQLQSERQRTRFASKMRAEFSQAVVKEVYRLLEELNQAAEEVSNAPCQQKLITIQRLLDDLSDMADTSLAEEGQEAAAEELNLRPLIDEATLSIEQLLHKQQRQLIVDYAPDFPDQISVQRRRLLRLLRHLLRQAAQLSTRGDLRLELSWQPQEPRLCLRLLDEGGVLQDEQRIEHFQAAGPMSPHYDRPPGSLGLGQLLARQLIQEMKGQFELRSRPEGGVELLLALPASTTSAVAAARAPILVVDDGPVNAMLASNVLERAGYQVEVVASGIEALQRGAEQLYSLVLMDIFMPEMDGLETTRRWRQLPNANAQIPVLAITANALEEDQQAFWAAGLNDYLAKPYRPLALRQLVEKWSLGASPLD